MMFAFRFHTRITLILLIIISSTLSSPVFGQSETYLEILLPESSESLSPYLGDPVRTYTSITQDVDRTDLALLFVDSSYLEKGIELARSIGVNVDHIFKSLPIIRVKADEKLLETYLSLLPANSLVKMAPNRSFQATYTDDIPSVTDAMKLEEVMEIIRANELSSFQDNLSRSLYGAGINIAILDSGINVSHPAIEYTYDYDGDGPYISQKRVIYEASFVKSEQQAKDFYEHGTHVASIAVSNGLFEEKGQIVQTENLGVAPSANLLSIKVLNQKGKGETIEALEGLDDAISLEHELKPDVVNMSFGSGEYNGTLDLMTELVSEGWRRGIIMVASAGNEGPIGSSIGNPGISKDVISVGATIKGDRIPYWSSWGPSDLYRPSPDVVAPGYGIIAADYTTAGYKQLGGTSMSAPLVSGLAAILRQAFPEITPEQVKTAIMSSSEDMARAAVRQGQGMINSVGALNLASNIVEGRKVFSVSPMKVSKENIFYTTGVLGSSKSFIFSIQSSFNGTVNSSITSISSPRLSITCPASINVTDGYTSFTVMLDLSDADFLEDITATIEFETANYFTNFPIEIRTIFPNGKILFDVSNDNDTQYLYYERDGMYGHLSYLSSLLEKEGWIVNESNETITSSLLEDYDLLIISDPDLGYSSSEIKAIQDYVQDEHALLIIGYGSNRVVEDDFYGDCNTTSLNELIVDYGIVLSTTNISTSEITGNLEHPSTGSTEKITYWGTDLTITDPSYTYSILTAKNESITYDVGAVYHNVTDDKIFSRVAVLGGRSFLDNSQTFPDFTGYSSGRFAVEFIEWLVQFEKREYRFVSDSTFHRDETHKIELELFNPQTGLPLTVPETTQATLITPDDEIIHLVFMREDKDGQYISVASYDFNQQGIYTLYHPLSKTIESSFPFPATNGKIVIDVKTKFFEFFKDMRNVARIILLVITLVFFFLLRDKKYIKITKPKKK
ncbi:MAG: S8 family serine peptidase [Candidatus Kariarchaeaceae archaeon]